MKVSTARMLRMLPKLVLAASLNGITPAFADDNDDNYEVWVSDQTNSKGVSATADSGTHGGFLRVYSSNDIKQKPPVNNPLNMDAADVFPNALAGTGSNVIRIHGMLPSPNHNYMNVNFVTSGHLGIIDARTKTAVALFRTTGTTTGRQNHMSFWSPDGKYLLLANQNGRMLERVNITWDASGENIVSAVYDAAASMDMVGGRVMSAQPVADSSLPIGSVNGTVPNNQPTTTPNGVLKQAAGIRPANTVICPIASSNSKHSFVTFGGGGMFVVDYTVTPMQIVAEYDMTTQRPAGCGGVEGGGYVHLDAGTPGPDKSEFTIYRFNQADFPVAPGFNAPNMPTPVVVFADPDNGLSIHGNNRDAHGMGMTKSHGNQPQFLHQFDRVRNVVETFNMTTLARNTYSLTTANGKVNGSAGTVCGTTTGATTSNDPTPDLLDLSPEGNRFYVALRGPFPLTLSHAATGSCPGLGIVGLKKGFSSGALSYVLPTVHMNYAGTKNISDPHGAAVRVIRGDNDDDND